MNPESTQKANALMTTLQGIALTLEQQAASAGQPLHLGACELPSDQVQTPCLCVRQASIAILDTVTDCGWTLPDPAPGH